ncbi:hypothetical protein [Robbsia sp. KACC 23696]|uniref:hypothetical protein n=1 Tax=Robbsia sp. KACC 23696 TaxID=3149231 RepID=UPI00325BCE8F
MAPEQKPDLDAPELEDPSDAPPHEAFDDGEQAEIASNDPSNPTTSPLDPIGGMV